ncbi:MAG: PAS domain S-box protein [Burkholderiales bacterium]|nr:PAS domain S-box protein [Burkholderiales bacterium]
MSTEPLLSRLRRLNLREAVWGAGALVIVGMSAFQVYDVLRRLEIVLESGEREAGTAVRLLAEQAAGAFALVDLALQEVRTARALPRTSPDAKPYPHLPERFNHLPQIRDLVLVSASLGAGRESAAAGMGDMPDVVREQLRSLAHDRSDALHASTAFFLQSEGSRTVALSRYLPAANGAAEALVVAYLDLEYFRRFYASLDLPPGSRVSLLGRDAQPLVEHPVAAARDRGSFPGSPIYQQLLASSPGLGRLLTDPTDGSESVYAAQPVPGFPFAVGLSTPKSTLLAPWYVQAMHSAARTASLCISVALLMWLLLRQLSRREQTEAQLRVQTASLDELIESAPEAIAMLDLRGRIARVNREFTRLFGYTAEQALGHALESLIVPADLQQESLRMARAVHEGQHVSTETQRQRSDGTRLTVSALSAPIVAVTGPIASYAIYRDITERRFAEGERAKLESRLREAEKLEAIGTMAGGIAHDFNGILSAILAYGNLALASANDGEVRGRHIAGILAAADRGRGLIEQILTYSRSTRGTPRLVDVVDVVRGTLQLVRAALPADIALHPHLPLQPSMIVADPTHVHQLVTNLCTNAAHSMHGGGTLEVTLEQLESVDDKVVSHGVLPEGRYVALAVRDTGQGIAPAVLEHIFEPFFTTGHPGGGTGLGLALVYAIMTEIGGAIDVQTAQGAGSTFTLYLPVADAPVLEHADQPATLPRGAGERVLLVEDEPGLMLLEEEMLAALNYEPAGFTRPTDALSEFTADPSRFDAILLDQLLPELTGLELARRMRASREDLPIILITGYRGPLLAQEARAAGVAEILHKPLDFRRLALALERALRARKTGASQA